MYRLLNIKYKDRVGLTVRHKNFGLGIIVDSYIDDMDDAECITIRWLISDNIFRGENTQWSANYAHAVLTVLD